MLRRPSIRVIALALTWLAGQSAYAASVSGTASCTVSSAGNPQTCPSVYTPAEDGSGEGDVAFEARQPHAASLSGTGPYDRAHATYGLKASHGHLGVQTSTYASSSFADTPLGAQGGTVAMANAIASAEETDTLTIVSDVLPEGTPILLRYAIAVEGTTQVSENFVDRAVASLQYETSIAVYHQNRILRDLETKWCFNGSIDTICDKFLPNDQPDVRHVEVFQFFVFVGDVITYQGKLWAQSISIAHSGPMLPHMYAESQVDGYHSAYVGFEVSEGAWLETESGHRYVMPIPETHTAAMALAGLFVATWGARRRKARR